MALLLIVVYLVLLTMGLHAAARFGQQPWYPKEFPALLTSAVVLAMGTTAFIGWLSL
jgi:hypothetical protein